MTDRKDTMANTLKTNDRLHGFTVRRVKPIAELEAELVEMEHDATGLKLAWLSRDDDNKTFGIAFQTLPEDDTGVFHILEHSVLNGSDRYPVKEPFVELMKSSLNTFLNALTFPDKTLYPVSSRNDQDLLNLMRVYLDAVFHPKLLSCPEIFAQEGWHYTFDEEGNAGYSGVVFNEMKGAFADPDELLYDSLGIALFPDSPYRFNSGGDPEKIPDLTWEKFAQTHRRFYSPSNAYIILDGDLDIDTVLGVIEDEYLSGLLRGERLMPAAMQAPVSAPAVEVEYEISEEEDENDRYRIAWGGMIGRFDERERVTAAQVLADAIGGTNQSPLTHTVLETGLAEDVILSVNTSIPQPWMMLEVRNVKKDGIETVKNKVRSELEKLAQGLDREVIEAVMANMEFRMRERDYGGYPKGLIFGIDMLDSWMYGGEPEMNLEVGTLFEDLKKKLDAGYFEKLLRSIFLENPHEASLTLVPSHTAGQKRAEKEQARIAAEEALWEDGKREELKAYETYLNKWQAREDTPEALATIPQLTIRDLDREPEKLPLEEMTIGGRTVLYHAVPTGGITYMTLYFDADGLSAEELSALSFLCELPGRLDTDTHTSGELLNLERLLIGSLNIGVTSFRSALDPETFTVKLGVSFNALERNIEEAAAYVTEILTRTNLEKEAPVRELMKQKKTQINQRIVMSGTSVAMERLYAQYSANGMFSDVTGGYAYYRWLKKADEKTDYETLKELFGSLMRRIIVKERLTVSVTGELTEAAKSVLEALPGAFGQGTPAEREILLVPFGKRREAVVVPSDVAFAVRGGMFTPEPDGGIWAVIGKAATLGYLWNTIRVQGGAYGTGMAARFTGFAACYSYRDPDPARSLEKYPEAADWVEALCASGESLDGFIIGAVADSSPLLTPRRRGSLSDACWFSGDSWELRCRRRASLIDATKEEILKRTAALREALADGGVCVIGSRAQIDAIGGWDCVNTL